MTLEQFLHLAAQAGPLGWLAMMFPETFEQGLFVAAFAQGRKFQGQAADAVVQIFAETAQLHLLAQRSVGGGDDADVHREQLGAAHRLHATLLQHPQQAGLGRQGHVADFVEEQCAAVGLADQADAALLVGAGEGAFFVTEQFRFHQLGRDRRAVDRNEWLLATGTGLVQGLDEHFLADAGLTVDQQRNVLFQQAFGLAHGLFHAAVTKVQSIEADDVAGGGRGGRGDWFGEDAWLDRYLVRALEHALETIAPGCLQGEWQAVGLVQQFQQRDFEQAFDTDPRQAQTQQVIGPAVGGKYLAALIENQQAGPLAVEVVQSCVEDQLEVFTAEQVENQPVFHGLAHHLDHAQGVGGRQVAVAGHVQYGDDLALGIEDRRGGTGHEAVGLEEVFIVFNVHCLLTGQCGADGVGAGATLHPASPGAEPVGQFRFDETLGAPGGEHLALIVGQHDQAIGVAEDVLVVRQDFLVSGLHQGMLAFQQLGNAFGGQWVEGRRALVIQAKGTAAGPGGLDDGVVGQGRSWCGHGALSQKLFLLLW